MEKVLLVDGYSITSRAYYAIKTQLTGKNGMPTGAIMGFFNMLYKVVEEYNPDYVIVTFDAKGEKFRHEIYSAYKGNRKKMDEDLLVQANEIQELIKMMGIELVVKEGIEADDVIGIISANEVKNGREVLIYSGDSDLYALVDDNTHQIYPNTKTKGNDYITYKEVEEKFGTTGEGVYLYKAIKGDSSDNIPGVSGLGDVAAKNIVKYNNLDNLYDNIDDIELKKYRKKLIEEKENAYCSYKLAKILRKDEELVNEYKLSTMPKDIDVKLKERLEELSLKSLLDRFNVSGESKKKSIDIVDCDNKKFKAVVDAKSLPYEVAIAVDIKEDLLAVRFEDDDKVYLLKGDINEGFTYLDEGVLSYSCYDIKTYYNDMNITRDGRDFFDVKIASYVLNSTGVFSYDGIYDSYSDNKYDVHETKDINERVGFEAFVAWEVKKALEEKIVEEDVYRLFYEIEMPVTFVLAKMSKVGIGVDEKELDILNDKFNKQIKAIEKEIFDIVGHEFNINSPKQLGEVLFDEMKLPFGKKNKNGWSTAASILDKLNYEPIVELVVEYRKYEKLNSTYVKGLKSCIVNGRIHGKFHQTVTSTGRISSSDPNLQNLPIRTEEGRELRKAFKPRDGYVFVDADYSQVELRILAHLSEDEVMIDDFKNGGDIHRSTAARIFGISPDEVTGNERRSAKAINFGIIYGMGSFSLGENLSISMKDANKYIENYFNHYKKVKKYLDDVVEIAKEIGYTKTMFGRRRYIPELSVKNFFNYNFGKRIAMNSPIQGTAADIMKIAMNNVAHRLNHDKIDAQIVLQIHDELLIETKIGCEDKVRQVLEKEMAKAVDLLVNLLIDVNVGEDLYSLK